MSGFVRHRFQIVVTIGYGASLLAYSTLPTFSRPFVAFLLPTTAAVIYALMRRLWARDAIRDGDDSFEAGYDAIFFAVVLFIVTLHLMMLAALTGVLPPQRVWLLRSTLVMVGLVMVRIGNLLPRTRPNLVVGIRTWRTLGDRRFWMQIHRTTGYVMVTLGAVIIMSGTLLSRPRMNNVLGASLLIATAVILVSYRRYSHASVGRA
jgi:hypothetical protein